MGTDSFAYRKPAGVVAAVAVSLCTVFAGAPVSAADPYDGDDGGSSYDGGGDSGGGGEGPSGGGVEAPSGGGVEEPSGGDEEPSGGDTHDEPGSTHEEPGGTHEEPSGGGNEPSGGGTNEVPGAGPNTGNGGNASEPTPRGPQAPQPDVKTASGSEVTTTTSTQMTSEEVTTYQESISSTVSTSSLTTGLSLSSPVALWNSGWIFYDRFYRPVFTNPYRTPLSVVYTSGGQPQVFTVPPLQRAALNVPSTGVYNFTAMTRPDSGPATNLSVGSFSGGGYEPAPGQVPPQPPASLNTQKNVLVQVKFDRGTSAPFRVKTLTDLGADPAVNGTTKVLLDEEIPAWGQWSKTDKGEALFVINQTQTIPGINPPAQEPLPGYNVKLTAAEKASWIDKNKTLLISVAAGAGVLALAGVGFILLTRRKRGTE
ncbi:hypothetical protein [Mycolicibacterium sphagni]|uniref:Gram-positive cocci surface proteins LPxTG domain-containing protein n=1 Tax=Mycolicibacterium sphagni TaxID=1786 RepID=A0ABX2K429_9MYCO|nr:hypothetical protein [Mycolicibacterium sphagni]NTY62492.1 hypothetical protein [Mycolicibacterium sphagni]